MLSFKPLLQARGRGRVASCQNGAWTLIDPHLGAQFIYVRETDIAAIDASHVALVSDTKADHECSPALGTDAVYGALSATTVLQAVSAKSRVSRLTSQGINARLLMAVASST